MRYKTVSLLETSEMMQSISGLLIYDEKGNEFSIKITRDGEIKITSIDGRIYISPNSYNQITLCINK